jgi:hypothetical protein
MDIASSRRPLAARATAKRRSRSWGAVGCPVASQREAFSWSTRLYPRPHG